MHQTESRVSVMALFTVAAAATVVVQSRAPGSHSPRESRSCCAHLLYVLSCARTVVAAAEARVRAPLHPDPSPLVATAKHQQHQQQQYQQQPIPYRTAARQRLVDDVYGGGGMGAALGRIRSPEHVPPQHHQHQVGA